MENREQIKSWIAEFIREYRESHTVETQWREPVIGVADAEDPLYQQLKTIISPSHALPSELIPGAKSVIVYFIPFAESVITSNIPDEESSREWDYAYIETNNMLAALSQHLFERITALGYHATNLPPTYNYDEKLLRSDWSHRSSAVIAGIGTFGINNMLITEAGCCGRIGSVVTDWKLEPTQRPREEYCLYKRDGSCGLCLKRCPNLAFSVKNGEVLYDRYKCNEQIYDKIIPQWPIGPGDTCGKCLCGVPCSFKNPSK